MLAMQNSSALFTRSHMVQAYAIMWFAFQVFYKALLRRARVHLKSCSPNAGDCGGAARGGGEAAPKVAGDVSDPGHYAPDSAAVRG